jgi:N-acetylglucosaminyl-diphospho-decaprenol L-rhamnosyltransferase
MTAVGKSQEHRRAGARDIGATAARFSVIVVTFNSANHLAECIRSVPRETELVLVDNGSSDGCVELACRIRPDSQIHCSTTNRGFGGGCNIGARVAGRELLLFLNPDAFLVDGALDQFASVIDAEPRVIVGPEIQDSTGMRRAVCRRSSRPVHELRDLLPLGSRVLGARTRDIPADDPLYEVGGQVDYLQGAALALARPFFVELGGFDEAYFLYSEEEDLCVRAREAGGRCIYAPTAAVRHLWGTSTAQVTSFSTMQRFRSLQLLYRRRYGSVRGALVGVALGLAICSRAAIGTIRPRRGVELAWATAAVRGLIAGTSADLSRRLPFV